MELSAFEWLKIGASVASVFGALGVYLWGRDRAVAISDAVSDERWDQIIKRFDHMDIRLDRAGQKSSDEATRIMAQVNAFSERLVRLETRFEDRQ